MTANERHPKGLYVLFATEMWERFGFYTMLRDQKYALPCRIPGRDSAGRKDQATSPSTPNYLMFVYFTPSDRRLALPTGSSAIRRTILFSAEAFFIAAGYALLGRRLGSHPLTYYIALGLLFVGNGFFKPNISTMVGNLYPARSALKDSAYNIF